MKGITRYDGSQFQVFTIEDHRSIIPRPYIQDIKEDKDGNIWVAAYGGGVSRYNGSDWLVFTSADELPSDNARSIFFDSEDNIYIITDKGVSRFDGTDWRTLTSKDGLPDGEIRTATMDDTGKLWFGSDKGEIKRIQ
jgi:ligand-binding sensor domain-containing protein